MTLKWRDITWAVWDLLRDIFRTRKRKALLFFAVPFIALALGMSTGCHSTDTLGLCTSIRPENFTVINWWNDGNGYARCRFHNYTRGTTICGWVRFSDHAADYNLCGTPA